MRRKNKRYIENTYDLKSIDINKYKYLILKEIEKKRKII
jgi:hypothetical protein